MSDEQALYCAVLAAPLDNLPRLVYADWLDDSGIPHNAARAEFIRAQIRMAELDEIAMGEEDCGHKHCDHCAERRELADRESVLFGQNWFRWREAGPKWSNVVGCVEWNLPHHAHVAEGSTCFVYRRGFVSQAMAPLREFRRAAGWLTTRFPLTAIHLTDRYPADPDPGGSTWAWFEGNALCEHSAYHLPSSLFRHLDRRSFATEQDARNGLSRACIGYCNEFVTVGHCYPGEKQ